MNENDPIELHPSFPDKLVRVAIRLGARHTSFGLRALRWLTHISAFSMVYFIVLELRRNVDNSWGIAAIAASAMAYMACVYSYDWKQSADHLNAERRACDRSSPIRYRFTPNRFVVDGRNFRGEYAWSVIDEIAQLPSGTGVRAGVSTFPIADEDLPVGLLPEVFRDRLKSWKSAA